MNRYVEDSRAAVQTLSWEEECLLRGAERCWWRILMPLRADSQLCQEDCSGYARCRRIWCSDGLIVRRVANFKLERSSIHCWIRLIQRIYLNYHKQSLEQVTARAGSNVCAVYMRRLAVVAGWLISSSGQVAKVISLKPIHSIICLWACPKRSPMRSNMALPLKLMRGDIQPLYFLTLFFYVFGVYFIFFMLWHLVWLTFSNVQ